MVWGSPLLAPMIRLQRPLLEWRPAGVKSGRDDKPTVFGVLESEDIGRRSHAGESDKDVGSRGHAGGGIYRFGPRITPWRL